MFNETTNANAGPAPVMVYNTRYHGRQRGQRKACCAPCAQRGLSGCGCSPTEVIVVQEPTSETQSTTTATGIPGWLILVALGVGALVILK